VIFSIKVNSKYFWLVFTSKLSNPNLEVNCEFMICHLQIKTAPFLVDFHFKTALVILSYP